MASPKLLFTATFVLTFVLLASCSREIQDEEGSECNFKGTCKTGADCVKICGDDAALCVPGIGKDHRCCCLQHDGPPRTSSPGPAP